jgi:hypothetical protein
MKIVFVTARLESGKDGVGDYTRLLAAECVRQGEACCLLSLNDSFVADDKKEVINVNNISLPVLRLSSANSWDRRLSCAKEFFSSFDPEWVSLQFVSYGFQDKGMVVSLDKKLKQLFYGYKTHIMFHELWSGQYKGARLKEAVNGIIQRFFILRLIRQLKPLIIHTSTSAYIALLTDYNIETKQLPLFGAIPVRQDNADSWLFAVLQQAGLNITKENRHLFWLLGIFGTLHPGWPPRPLFDYLNEAAIRFSKKIAIISIGYLNYGEDHWKNISQTYGNRFRFIRLGEQSLVHISQFFNSIDFGIATTPYNIIGKSISVAAMLEHGLPVIVNWQGHPLKINLRQMPVDEYNPLLYKMDRDMAAKIIDIRRGAKHPRVYEIAARFIADLKNARG